MHTWDIFNGVFEFLAAVMVYVNCRRLRRDRKVAGITPWSTVFFLLWGIFNIFFYPSQGLWWSFCCGVLVVVCNLYWIGLVVYYWLEFPASPWSSEEELLRAYTGDCGCGNC